MTKLIIICGLSFAGKTTLAKAISTKFGYVEVDVDDVKDTLFGVGVEDNKLNHDDWVKLYKETDDQIAKLLREGKTVIDASRNFRKSERKLAKHIADKTNAQLVTIFIDTPEEIVRERWQRNRDNQTRHDVSDKGFEEIIQVMETPTPDESALIFEHGDDINTWISKNFPEA